MKFLNVLFFLSLFTLISCGKESDSSPYLEEVNLNQAWKANETSMLTEIDLTDLNNVTFLNVYRDGVSDNCTYSATLSKYNAFYGTLKMTYVSGDTFICSQYVGSLGYEAFKDLRSGVSTLNLIGINFEL
jgi:hypothetical protein